ncbi:MAG: ABC transporter substrate-binding protein [Marinovum algicola]|jgi:alpha-glucoside transport system substrate-binding protein|uniref:Alpha-glucoside transport system substrate-binding protein n=1 Tax=Marinovum algicola TaxID=42444 RepID=A0A975W8G7_9RHOB|nr:MULTISPECIES: ABC transporter substrate-binding protein [Marinovum]MDD9745566.1 ABC transporter substrate-binding protein [Marinovum sp. PR37]SEJ09448.1 alpha-glucoside transport system substrate-binding protein [Marinovum algicola]SLN20461.1 Bacterial extracellular solute-binding protein [Marinovum algicola]
MKFSLYASVAAFAMTASLAQAEAHLPFAKGEGDFNWESLDAFAAEHDLNGEEISIFGPWRGDDQGLVESIIDYFEEATGAEVSYASSESYEQQIVIDTEAGSPPNVAVLPQPGLIQDLVSKGFVEPLSDDTQAWLKENYAAGESWVSLGTFTGPDGEDRLYAFPYKIDLKSLVWYSPDNFDDAGYEVPETMEELKALTEQIVADGETPWCIGLGSGGATGWPATDWVEDLMLRTQPPETYDKWVSNEIKFDDPAVIGAIEEFGYFARDDAKVAGGAGAVASTDFRDSPDGIFASPPQCYMHRQASFIPTFFPEGIQLGVDADFFYFPAYEEKDLGKPVLGAGTLAFITKDSPGAQAFIEFLKTPIAHELWMAQSGFLTPHTGVDTGLYANDVLKKQGDILLDATTFRFDGSDLMPTGVGAGSFWTGMVDYAGGTSAEDVAKSIQDSWNALK